MDKSLRPPEVILASRYYTLFFKSRRLDAWLLRDGNIGNYIVF